MYIFLFGDSKKDMVSFPGNDLTNKARTVSRCVISLGNNAFLVSSLNIKNTKPEREVMFMVTTMLKP